MKRIRLSLLLATITIALAALPTFAQKVTGDISGTVTDATGAVVANAKVTAENPATKFTVSATTSDTGGYRIVNLPPGTYKLSVTATGFKTAVRDAEVSISAVTTANFQMAVGAAGETVTVEAASPLVETVENRLSTLFEAQRVENLPNSGRDFNNLLDGIPGVQRSPGGGFQSLNINGQRATTTNFAVDGIPNNDRYYGESALNQAAIAGTAATLVPLEGITEFNVQSNPGAEYGVRGGSVVNVGLKSGTNAFHGGAFWIRHTDAFDARNFFSDPDAGTNPFRLNQYGVHGGGPIIKDKTFFYGSFQGFRLKSTFPSTITVPTPAEIFDATACVTTGSNPDTSNDPLGAVPCLNTGPGPGSDQIFGTADDGTVSSIGAGLLSFIPTSPTGQLNIATANTLDVDGFHFKVDHIFNDRHRISGKYIFGDSVGDQPPAPGVPPSVGQLATSSTMWNSVAPSRAQLAGINYTWTISANKVLESRIGWTRFSQRIGIGNDINPNDLGINTGPLGSDPNDRENFGIPTVYYLGYFGNTDYGVIGGIQGYPIVTAPNSTYDVQEHFTWTKGRHTLKMGGQFQNAYTKSRRDRARSDLSFGYYGFYYCAYYALCDPAFAGIAPDRHVASLNQLLLGMASGSSRSFGDTNRRIFQDSLGVYMQDSWKVKPNFTLELGLRWDVAGALGEDNNQGSNFLPGDPNADANGFVSLDQQPLHKIDKNNFGPRVGFAWDMFSNGRSVLRGGYTLNYDLPNFGTIHAPQTFANMFTGARAGAFTQINEGNFPIAIFSTPASNQAIFTGNSLCQVFVCVAPGVNIYGQSVTPEPPFNIVQVKTDLQTPMLHAVNLSLEQELSRNLSAVVSYVGTFGRDLIAWRDINACPADPVLACDTSRRPFFSQFPQYDHITQANNDSYSNYNALQASLKMRTLHGLTGQFNFVWSRAFDTGSANRGGDFLTFMQNPYDPDFGYAPANFDVPLNFNFSVLYDVPKLGGPIFNGWQIASLFRASQGRPFTVFQRGDPSNQGLRSTWGNYDGSPIEYDYDNPDQFFNTSAFSENTIAGTVGNAGRNRLRQPPLVQWDMSVFKEFKIGEQYAVRFSWEVFNVLNHTNFAFDTGNVRSGGFGTFFATPDVGIGFNPILGTGAPRNMQFGLRFTF
ncbi:MAG: TonB-dependent receptor [Acidobacteriales bacterium]|nr:TonB-dependent receptor [Terriglobales bacterium]